MPGRRTIYWLHYLPRHDAFCFGLHRLSQFTYVFEFEHACICFISMSHIFPSQCTPIGSAERPWTATQKGQPYYLDVQKATLGPHSFGSTHSCLFHSSPQNPHYPVQPPLTSHLNWSEKTPSHPNSGIKILEPTLMKAASPCRPFKSFLPPTLLPTRRYISASIALSTSSLQANLQKDIADIEREWKTIWEVFPELSKNPIREPATIAPSISSTISHTNIFSTTHHTLCSISYTTNSHSHSHTTDHLHHTNTTAPTTSSITTLTPIISPKQPFWKKTKNPACTTSTASTTTTSNTMSINTSAPTILPKKPRSKRRNNPPRSPSQGETHPHSVRSFPPISAESNTKISPPIHTPQN